MLAVDRYPDTSHCAGPGALAKRELIVSLNRDRHIEQCFQSRRNRFNRTQAMAANGRWAGFRADTDRRINAIIIPVQIVGAQLPGLTDFQIAVFKQSVDGERINLAAIGLGFALDHFTEFDLQPAWQADVVIPFST